MIFKIKKILDYIVLGFLILFCFICFFDFEQNDFKGMLLQGGIFFFLLGIAFYGYFKFRKNQAEIEETFAETLLGNILGNKRIRNWYWIMILVSIVFMMTMLYAFTVPDVNNSNLRNSNPDLIKYFHHYFWVIYCLSGGSLGFYLLKKKGVGLLFKILSWGFFVINVGLSFVVFAGLKEQPGLVFLAFGFGMLAFWVEFCGIKMMEHRLISKADRENM